MSVSVTRKLAILEWQQLLFPDQTAGLHRVSMHLTMLGLLH